MQHIANKWTRVDDSLSLSRVIADICKPVCNNPDSERCVWSDVGDYT